MFLSNEFSCKIEIEWDFITRIWAGCIEIDMHFGIHFCSMKGIWSAYRDGFLSSAFGKTKHIRWDFTNKLLVDGPVLLTADGLFRLHLDLNIGHSFMRWRLLRGHLMQGLGALALGIVTSYIRLHAPLQGQGPCRDKGCAESFSLIGNNTREWHCFAIGD